MDPAPQSAPKQPNSGPPDLTAALHRLWLQFLPQIEDRAAVLESAAAALAHNKLSAEQRQAAHAAAHKLAGTLGTFGLAEGTSLAREAELLYAAESELTQTAATRLAEVAHQLRIMLESRK